MSGAHRCLEPPVDMTTCRECLHARARDETGRETGWPFGFISPKGRELIDVSGGGSFLAFREPASVAQAPCQAQITEFPAGASRLRVGSQIRSLREPHSGEKE